MQTSYTGLYQPHTSSIAPQRADRASPVNERTFHACSCQQRCAHAHASLSTRIALPAPPQRSYRPVSIFHMPVSKDCLTPSFIYFVTSQVFPISRDDAHMPQTTPRQPARRSPPTPRSPSDQFHAVFNIRSGIF